MARDGGGTMIRNDGTTLGNVWGKAKLAGRKILSADHDIHDQDMANEISNSLAKDGQTVRTGNQNYGGNSITNYGASGVTLAPAIKTTFTPSFYDSTAALTFSHSNQTGHYAVVDNMVFFNLYVFASYTGTAGTNTIGLEGLPFNAAAAPTQSSVVNVGSSQNITHSNGNIIGSVVASTDTLFLFENNGPSLTWDNTTSAVSISVQGWYFK